MGHFVRAAVTFAAILAVAGPTSAASSDQVEAALAKAKKYVYSQHKNGTWEKSPKPDEKSDDKLVNSQWGGQTAIAAYALLASGENPNTEPRLAEAIDFLKKARLGGTYALGLRCQVWLLLPQTPEVKTLMRRDSYALQSMMKTQGEAKGFYDYDARGKPTTYSLSRAQYAVLGVWGAAQSGAEIPADYWRKVEAAWARAQEQDGGWRYMKGGGRDYPITAGMTAAGVATLLVAQEYLLADTGSQCNGNPANPAIDRGLAWLDQNFHQVAAEQEYDREYPFATLYAVERVGVASGLKYFGRNDWYQKGVDYLVKRQKNDGSWKGGGSYFGALPDTCFGMLFLARGRAPLLMNKLQHGAKVASAAAPDPAAGAPAKPNALEVAKKLAAKPDDWNQRPRDVANLAHWISSVAERDLNWQVLGPAATVRDLHDAPIAYLSGTQSLRLSEEMKAKLREYVEGGGLILGQADCGGRTFAASFQKLGAELFPNYEFRELPADHVIYTGGVYPREKWKTKPSVLGLSNGARELMLLIPQADAGRAWQQRVVGGKEELWQLGANIFFYTAERRNLRYRGDSHLVLANPEIQPERNVTLVRLEYPGNWDPEPGAWRRVAAVLRNDHKLGLDVKTSKLGGGTLSGAGASLAHLTGTATFKLDDSARKELKGFVQAGGTLLVDAAGGSAPFAEAAEAELKSIFPETKAAPLQQNHAIFSAGGGKPTSVAYRAFAQKSVVGSARAPRLHAITLGGRPAVIFSREDLSVGMVGQPVDGVIGYDPRTATDIASRLVLHVAGGGGAKPQAAEAVKDGKPDPKPAQPDLPF